MGVGCGVGGFLLKMKLMLTKLSTKFLTTLIILCQECGARGQAKRNSFILFSTEMLGTMVMLGRGLRIKMTIKGMYSLAIKEIFVKTILTDFG